MLSDHHTTIYGDNAQPHKATWTHEVLGGAAAFEAMRVYEKAHPNDTHQLSKEILVGLAGAELDKIFETKGLDFVDREKAKREAQKKADELYESQLNH